MQPVNELDYILHYLEANENIGMQTIATKFSKDYDYIRGQKTQKNIKKQSKKLVSLIKTAYAEELKNMPPYVKSFETGTAPESAVREKQTNYPKKGKASTDWTPEEEYRHELEREAEKKQILNDLINRVQGIEEKQGQSLALQIALTEYIAEKDANGNEELKNKIKNRLQQGIASQNTVSEKQGDGLATTLPDEPTPGSGS